MVHVLTDPAFWVAVGCWLFILLSVVALCIAGARDDRLVERARADVADRGEFRSWDASGDLANVVPLERRKPAELVEFPRQVGGWSK